MRSVICLGLLACTAPLVAGGGCGNLTIVGGFLNTVPVVLVNDTDFSVDPNIRFDDDTGLLAGLFPSETLSTGLLAPGETATFTFDCDKLGTILADDPEQIIPLLDDVVGDSSDRLERGEEFDCGDVIEFRFVGNLDDFGVVVSVNGRVVD